MWYFTNKLQIQFLYVFMLVFYPEAVDLNLLPKAGKSIGFLAFVSQKPFTEHQRGI